MRTGTSGFQIVDGAVGAGFRASPRTRRCSSRSARRAARTTYAEREEAEKAGDASHREARDAMKGRWRHPRRSMGWYRDTQRAFAALPDE